MTIIKNDNIITNENNRNGSENLNDKFINALMNPTRQRILEYLILHKTGTVYAISDMLSDIPRPSIYRHIKIMLESEIIEVESEKQIRGTVEKTYALSSNLTNDKSNDDMALIITRVLFSVLGSFSRYFAKPDVNPSKDMLSVASSTLMMTDDEFMEFMIQISGLINANIANVSNGKRKPRNILFASIPVEIENKGE